MSDTPRPPEGPGEGWAPPPAVPPQPVPDPGAWAPPAGRPSGGTDPGGGPPPDAVVVPAWLASDWLLALRVAGVGLALLFGMGAVITLVNLLGQLVGGAVDVVDWGLIALSPIGHVLGWFGAFSGAPLLLTGVLYVFLAYRVAARTASAEVRQVADDRTRTLAFAGKIAVITAGVLLLAALIVAVFRDDQTALGAGFGSSPLDLTTLVFFTFVAGTGIALFALLSATGTTIARLLGIGLPIPSLVRVGWTGARHVLLFGGVGLLATATLGSLLDDLTAGSGSIGRVLASLLFTVASLLQLWVDRALLLLLGTTKFLHDGGFAWSGLGEVAAWMWLALPLLLAAYVAGGVQAAKGAAPRTQIDAARAALLVGPLVAAVTLLVAIGWAGQAQLQDIVAVALLLPTLWGVVAVGGAWLWANQQGLASGLVVEQPEAGAADGPPPPAPRDQPPPPGAHPPG